MISNCAVFLSSATINLLDQSRVIITRPAAIDPLGDRSRVQNILAGRRLHNCRRGRGIPVDPSLELVAIEDHRRPIVDFGDEGVRLCDDHRA
jgi:hypothetical protein